MLGKYGNGLSQVILQKSQATTICFALGLLLCSPLMFAGALAGLVISTLAGQAIDKEKGRVKDGLYGYNGVLVGIAAVFFFGWTPAAATLLVVFAALSSAVQLLMLQRGITSYTAPFVLATWGVFVVGEHVLHLPRMPQSVWIQVLPDLPVLGPLTGVGQIMFQGSALTGLLFVIGVALSCGSSSAWLFLGSTLGGLLALALRQNGAAIEAGLFGFNAALSAFVLASSGRRIWRVLGGIAASVALTLGFNALGFPALTAPFVISTWLFSFDGKVQH